MGYVENTLQSCQVIMNQSKVSTKSVCLKLYSLLFFAEMTLTLIKGIKKNSIHNRFIISVNSSGSTSQTKSLTGHRNLSQCLAKRNQNFQVDDEFCCFFKQLVATKVQYTQSTNRELSLKGPGYFPSSLIIWANRQWALI